MTKELKEKTHLVFTVERGGVAGGAAGRPPLQSQATAGIRPPSQAGSRPPSQAASQAGTPSGTGLAGRRNDLVPPEYAYPDLKPEGHQPHRHHHSQHHHHHDDDRHAPLPDLGPPAEPGYALDAYVEGRWLAEAPRNQTIVNRERRRDWGYDAFYMWRTDPLTSDDLTDPFGEWRYRKEEADYYLQLQEQRRTDSFASGQQRYPPPPPGQGQQRYANNYPPPPPSQGQQRYPPPPGQGTGSTDKKTANPERLLAGPPLRGAGPEAAFFLPYDTMEGAAARRRTPPSSPRDRQHHRAAANVPQLTYGGPLRPTMSVAPRGGPVTMVMAPSQIGTTDRLAPVRVVGAY
mmetsp:Transcript_10458/g.23271  ORF Transcript_10458/g.23271 Transcript_10458/m.23271 type:complete len:346 (-) Transcript_10458:34-1071(-)